MSGVQLEIRRLILKAQEQVINQVLALVKKEIESLHQKENYEQVLYGIIKEAIEGLGEKEVVVRVAPEENQILEKSEILSRIREEFQTKYGREFHLEIKVEAINRGIIAESLNGSVSYNNTYAERLNRMQDRLRAMIAKQLWEEGQN